MLFIWNWNSEPLELVGKSRYKNSRLIGKTLPGSFHWGPWHHPAHFPAFINDGAFHGLNCYRILNYAQNTGSFAWCRAHTAGELWKIIGFEKSIQRFSPSSLIHKLIPFGNFVSQWTPTMVLFNVTEATHPISWLCSETPSQINCCKLRQGDSSA